MRAEQRRHNWNLCCRWEKTRAWKSETEFVLKYQNRSLFLSEASLEGPVARKTADYKVD